MWPDPCMPSTCHEPTARDGQRAAPRRVACCWASKARRITSSVTSRIWPETRSTEVVGRGQS